MSASCTDITKAERHVIRAAMGCVNAEGWVFRVQGDGRAPIVIFQDSVRRLESAIARLREARKAKRGKRRSQ